MRAQKSELLLCLGARSILVMDRLLDQMNPSAALFPRGLSGINSEGNPCCESTQNQKNGAQNLKVVHRKK